MNFVHAHAHLGLQKFQNPIIINFLRDKEDADVRGRYRRKKGEVYDEVLEILYDITKTDTDKCLLRAHLNCRTGAPSINTVYHTHAVTAR